MRADPARDVVGHVGLGRPEPGIHAQRVAQARAGDVGHDHNRCETIVRGGERVHHRRQPPGQQPVLRTPRLARDQHQHGQPRPQRAQISGREIQPCGPGREVRTLAGDRHLGDLPCAGHTRRHVPGAGQRLPRAGGPHRRPRGQLRQVDLVGGGHPERGADRGPVSVVGVDLHRARPEHRHHRHDGQRDADPAVAAPRPPEPDRDGQHRDPREHASGQEVGERAEHGDGQTDGRGDDHAGDDDQRHVTQPPGAGAAHQQPGARDRADG